MNQDINAWLINISLPLIKELIEENYSDLKLLRGRRERYNPPLSDDLVEIQIKRTEKVRDITFGCKFSKNISNEIPELEDVSWVVVIKSKADIDKIFNNEKIENFEKVSPEAEALINRNLQGLEKIQMWMKLSQKE